MKILLVEDDEGVRATVSLLFRMRWAEAQVVATRSGAAALDLVSNEDLNAVILDLGLPDINGFEVLKQIRLSSSIPVIILTARKEQDDIDEGFNLGADDYIVKPFKNAELLERVRQRALGYMPEETEFTPA